MSLTDRLALLALCGASLIIGSPVLVGGYLGYLDNPAHLAEVYSLARESINGWSEIAFCGFPLGRLHSPLWYGALVALAKLGVPVEPT